MKTAIDFLKSNGLIKERDGDLVTVNGGSAYGLVHAMGEYASLKVEEATKHASDNFKNMTQRCNEYHEQVTSQQSRIQELEKALESIEGLQIHGEGFLMAKDVFKVINKVSTLNPL